MSDAAYLTPPLEIEDRFLDHNGHVNMAYHLVLVDRALDLAFEEIKGPDYVEGRGMTTFAAEMHVRYLREITIGDSVRGRVLWIAGDDKRAHWAVALVKGKDEVATAVEGVSLSVEVATRRVRPFPSDVAKRLSALVALHAACSADIDWLGGRVGMRRA